MSYVTQPQIHQAVTIIHPHWTDGETEAKHHGLEVEANSQEQYKSAGTMSLLTLFAFLNTTLKNLHMDRELSGEFLFINTELPNSVFNPQCL